MEKLRYVEYKFAVMRGYLVVERENRRDIWYLIGGQDRERERKYQNRRPQWSKNQNIENQALKSQIASPNLLKGSIVAENQTPSKKKKNAVTSRCSIEEIEVNAKSKRHLQITDGTGNRCKHHYLLLRRVKNSSLVFALERIHPSMQLVVVVLEVFWTPRITMHKWPDSITTPTPRGFRTSEIAKATCLVSLSWTWSRRENISARRASLERPRTRRSGM